MYYSSSSIRRAGAILSNDSRGEKYSNTSCLFFPLFILKIHHICPAELASRIQRLDNCKQGKTFRKIVFKFYRQIRNILHCLLHYITPFIKTGCKNYSSTLHFIVTTLFVVLSFISESMAFRRTYHTFYDFSTKLCQV